VVVWISGLNLLVNTGENVSFFEEKVSDDGFTIHMRQQHECRMLWGAASWLAFTDDMGFCEGTEEIRPHSSKQVARKTVELPNGRFARPPRVFVAFKRINLSRDHNDNPRVRVLVDTVEATHFDLVVVSWEESVMAAATVQWLAIPA
jgi:hypothetical protein